jgi:hypothetical protein
VFYKCGYYLPACGGSSVVFAYNVDEHGQLVADPAYRTNYGVLVSVSGDGCRYLNSLIPDGMRVFMEFLTKYNPHCTRIDMACDFLDKDNEVVPLIQKYARQAYDRENAEIDFTCNLQRKPGFCTINSVYDDDVKGFTDNVTIGTRQSEKGQLQLYNKKVEMLTGRLSSIAEQTFKAYDVSDYWYRLEYRCKSFAPGVFDCVINKGVSKAYLFAMCAFGIFIDNIYSGTNSDKCPVVISWQEFYNFVDSLNLSLSRNSEYKSVVSVPYVRSSVAATMEWAKRNPALAYKLLLVFEQCPDFADSILDTGDNKLKEIKRYSPWVEDYNHCCLSSFPVNILAEVG